ncbi:O-antigen ligase C-terminal domain-containing protein [Burkholderia vietnamiensis]|jgi:O-antigen ligase|uniref:PglL family O-oligosaccharyltransferase n=1 Tax=Burkholderia vietnamiensis TaxID=60552 RepID=UPI001041B57C|nr:Wzy polymerase domain-containing protein [Burkholderia vietnamiensis]MBR8033511.1 O-antigen ligase C-terminal domain-containing protein [Burkholderia vietnamiensis]MBR8280648.1 O-antigen ligase C-terminal domain-containing protein [Burkholderia vietnamiensis]MCA8194639.1 Wzy polymerase domain-containing protein [Burkholderia vietnamiensis]MDN7410879.1 Wzy polymerase domain-containing protein [Burkholderia vietnamiensis]MDN8034479.1 Wzy polymerase domain-containing protein [Burkholderia viet
MPSTFSRSLSLVALAVALIVPYSITNHTYPIPTFYSEFAALVLYLLVGVSVVLLARTGRPAEPFAAPAAFVAPLGFGAVLLAQVALLPLKVPSMNWLALGYLAAALVAMQAGYMLARGGLAEATARMMAGALLVGGVFAVATQIVQLFHFESALSPFVVVYNIAVDRRPYGNMAQANHLATYIAFALAGALYLVQTRRLAVWAWLALSIVLSAGLALTVSRGPWLQVAVMVVAGFWMAWVESRRAPGNRRAWLIPVVLALAFVAVNVAVRWANVHFHLGLAESAAERMRDAGQIAPRLALWKYGLAMFREHPLLGVGWGEFPSHQFALARALGGVEIANNSHDIFIDLLAKSGLVGLGVLALALVAWFVRAVRAPQSSTRVFGFALIGVLLMHALVEYPQQYMFFLLPAMFVIGLLDVKPLRWLPGRAAFALFAVLSVGGVLAAVPVLRDYQRAEVLYYGTEPAVQYRDAPSLLFGAWGDYGAATLLTISPDNLPLKLAAHERAIALLPGETVLRRYAALQALAGREADALDTVERLHVFAKELKDWPQQLALLYKLCDEQPGLKTFKAAVVAKYGEVPADAEDDDSEDDSE